MIRQRSEVADLDKWDVGAIYPSLEAWEKEFLDFTKGPKWKDLDAFRGCLGESAELLQKLLNQYCTLARQLEKLYTYAHLRHDENLVDEAHKGAFDRIVASLHHFQQSTSWIEPEILSLPDSVLQDFLSDAQIEEYRFHLEKIVRMKPHTLPAEQERLLALAGPALHTSSRAFSAINDADFKFGRVQDGQGEEKELTHGSYHLFIRDQDRVLRKNAFQCMHGRYEAYENTLCELLHGTVQKHLFHARAKGYSSCLEASLYPKNVDTSVYRALIEAVNNNLDALHRYVGLRKKQMKVDELHLYDMYVPLTSEVDIKLEYDEAVDWVCSSSNPLGEEYQALIGRGLREERWVDRFENQNKRSGAYSSGCFDTRPYILMNYKGVLRDVFTLAHEAGHSMHSLLSRTHQPYHYADYPIFLAEVASTFNEELLSQALLKKYSGKKERFFLINEKIEDIRATLFRQTMFAEFELLIHELVERNEPLTPGRLKEEYQSLNHKYFGPHVTVNDEIAIEWARIPHFYYNFYVYQYATGISAALALSERVLTGGVTERNAYLDFLKGGSSRYPLELLEHAGVDMRTPAPVEAAISKFRSLVDELESLTSGEPVPV